MLYSKAARTALKVLATGLGLLLAATIAGSFWLAKMVRTQVAPALESAVQNVTGQLYHAQVGAVLVYPLGRRMVLQNLVLYPDSQKLRALRRQGVLPNKLLRISIPRLEVSGILWEHFYRRKSFVCGAIELTNPSVNVQLGAGGAPFFLRLPKTRQFSALRIARLSATGIRTWVQEGNSPKAYLGARSDKGVLQIVNLQTKKNAPIQFQRLQLSAGKTSVHLPFLPHQISAAGWQFDGKTLHFFMQGFKFVQKPTAGGDRTLHQVYIPALQVKGLRTVADSTRPLYEIARVSLFGPQLQARLARRVMGRFDSSERYFPQLLLQRAGVPLRIREVALQRGRVTFYQSHPKTGLQGAIQFEDLRGTLGPLLLQPLHEEALRDPLLLNLTGRFQHRTNLALQGTLSNRDSQQAFTLWGKLMSLEVGQIRETARNLGQINLREGTIDSLLFFIQGNTAGIKGQLVLAYTGLKLTPLRWDSVRRALMPQRFLSLLANELLLHDSNPAAGAALRTANIETVRQPYQSFFNTIWKALYDGILETVVADPELLQYARNKSATRAKRKEDRQRRKEDRQERRQERQERRR